MIRNSRFADLTAELQADLMCDALERLGVHAIVVAASGRVLFATAGAAIRAGARVEMCGGGSRTTEQRVVLIDRNEDRMFLQTYVVPLNGQDWPLAFRLRDTERPVAIMLFAQSQPKQRADLHALRERYGLTRTEIAVALQIAEGHGRSAAAAALGISLATVRTHLSHIFEKTGVRRQAELVRLVLKHLD